MYAMLNSGSRRIAQKKYADNPQTSIRSAEICVIFLRESAGNDSSPLFSTGAKYALTAAGKACRS